MSAPRHSIFISYRRVDSVYAVDQLDLRLKQAFGADAVFRDASSITPGAVFPEHIRRALGEARVALVVIGPWWLKATSDPNDLHSPGAWLITPTGGRGEDRAGARMVFAPGAASLRLELLPSGDGRPRRCLLRQAAPSQQ